MNIFKKNKYYIPSRLDRYKEYYKITNKSIDDIVKEVNCNLDYDYYTLALPAQINLNSKVLVNKYYKLDKNYVPDNLVYIDSNYSLRGTIIDYVNNNFIDMCNNALKEDLHLINTSSYRSYKRQTDIYNTAKEKEKNVDLTSAKPGYSEHQTGLALDIRTIDKDIDEFIDTKEYLWLKDNAYKYGFILRYPKGKEKLTGYSFEPWHYRYVGKEIAKYIKNEDITFDEYYAYFIEKES